MNELIQVFNEIQNWAVGLTMVMPLSFAFGAGLVASINPCSFLVLPSFGVYYMGLQANARPPWWIRLYRAWVMAFAATLGFVVLFGVIGLAITLLGQAFAALIPWLGIAVGGAIGLLGLYLLVSGQTFGLTALDRFGIPAGVGARHGFMFGVGYGTCALACSLPVFLVVVGTSLATAGLVASLLQYVLYALGMGVVILGVALSAALAGGALASALRPVRAWTPRISAVLLVGASFYILYYWLIYGQLLV